jgi:hypothetical protein
VCLYTFAIQDFVLCEPLCALTYTFPIQRRCPPGVVQEAWQHILIVDIFSRCDLIHGQFLKLKFENAAKWLPSAVLDHFSDCMQTSSSSYG